MQLQGVCICHMHDKTRLISRIWSSSAAGTCECARKCSIELNAGDGVIEVADIVEGVRAILSL